MPLLLPHSPRPLGTNLLNLLQKVFGRVKQALVVWPEMVALMQPVEGILQVEGGVPGLLQAAVEPLHVSPRPLMLPSPSSCHARCRGIKGLVTLAGWRTHQASSRSIKQHM